MAENKKNIKAKTSETVIAGAIDKFKESQDGSDFNRELAEQDIRFARMGEQWDKEIKKIRKEEGRPCLTINRLPAYIRQVVNESRQSKPGIIVSPTDNGADVETAEVIAGLIRSIERGGDGAEVAYDTAIDHAVTNGFGFFTIGIDYAHEDSFELEARIHRVANPLSVHWDSSSTKFDASDWNYGFVSDMLSEDEFEAKYPGADKVDFENDYRDGTEYWLEDNMTRVAEYWTREEKERNLFLMSDGAVLRQDQIPKLASTFLTEMGINPEGINDDELIQAFMAIQETTVEKERKAKFYEVKRRVISGVEVLEEEEWPGSMIPICPVWGEEVYSEGRRHLRSMIRDAKDPQAMFNFWRSASTELVALAPRAPWVVEEGAIPKGQEDKWQTANTRSHPYLEYAKGSSLPQRQPFAGVPAGALQEATNSATDIQDITGIYPSSFGARSNETSGVAIGRRERQSDTSNFHFLDNLARSIRYAGRVLVEIIPAVYSPKESVRILGEDMKEKVVQLTKEAGGPGEGKDRLYNLSVGKYDVTVRSGPTFSTQREETRETLVEIMTRIPDAAPLIGDVLMEHMDFQGADKVAKRLKMVLPENIRAAEDDENAEDNPEAAALKGQMQQLQQQAQQAQQEGQRMVGELQKELESIKTDKSIESQKLQLDGEIKSRELALKEQAAQKPESDDSIKLALEAEEAEAQRMFQAEQNDKDRQVELAKVILSKSPGTDPETDVPQAMREAARIVSVLEPIDEPDFILEGPDHPIFISEN